MFECTPDELDSLSNRIDYLEKICHKVERGAKKHKIHSNETINKEENKEYNDGEHKENSTVKETKEAEHVKDKEESKPDKEQSQPEHVKENENKTEHKEEHKEESSVKESAKENTPADKNEKEKESSKINESKNDETGEKKHFTSSSYIDDKKPPGYSKPFQDSASAALKSMIDIRAKLKISELDILDRIKQAKEGTMKNL